jgi:hypothetical protein
MSLNFEDFDEIDRFLKQHFENITPEEFKKNLKDACPDLFDDSNQLTYDSKATTHSTENSLLVNDNAEYQEIDRILKEHFKRVTPEEFRNNLAIACPDLLEGSKSASVNQNHVNVIDKEKVKGSNSPYTAILGRVWCRQSLPKEAFKYLASLHSSRRRYVIGALFAAVISLGTISIKLKPELAPNVKIKCWVTNCSQEFEKRLPPYH